MKAAFSVIAFVFIALCIAAPTKSDTRATMLARTFIHAMNTGDPATMHDWVALNGNPGLAQIEKTILKDNKAYGPHQFVKVVFDQPYEFVAQVVDGKSRQCHLTAWFDSKHRVSRIMLVRDFYP